MLLLVNMLISTKNVIIYLSKKLFNDLWKTRLFQYQW